MPLLVMNAVKCIIILNNAKALYTRRSRKKYVSNKTMVVTLTANGCAMYSIEVSPVILLLQHVSPVAIRPRSLMMTSRGFSSPIQSICMHVD